MAIKLLRAKKDIFWEDSLPDEKPFCTKDTWYEVISSSKECLTFKNDRGDEHPWMISEINEDFWTIDFGEGFEFINGKSKIVKVEDNLVKGVDWEKPLQHFKKVIIDNLLASFLKVKRYSNQKETPPKKVKPSKEERPYENWKMSISKDKFVRCIEPEEMIYETVEGLVGWLNKDTNMFYYKVKSKQYLSAKVYPFSYPDSTVGYEFVKENKDAKGYHLKSKPIIEDKYEFCPENIWDNFDWEVKLLDGNTLSNHTNIKDSISDVVESTRKGILASFGVPKDNLGQEESYSTELKFNHPEYNIVEGSESLEEEYTGGSVNYYKLIVEKPTNIEDPYEAECNDIIEALDMNYAEGNAFKAIWRKCAARKFGTKKKGYDNGLYDSEKVVFFGERMVVQSK